MSAILKNSVDTSSWSIIAINGSPFGHVGHALPIVRDAKSNQICSYSISDKPSPLWTPATEVNWLAETHRITTLVTPFEFPSEMNGQPVLAWFSDYAIRYFQVQEPLRELNAIPTESKQPEQDTGRLRVACCLRDELEAQYAEVCERVVYEFDDKLREFSRQKERSNLTPDEERQQINELFRLGALGVQSARTMDDNYHASLRQLVLLCLWRSHLAYQYYRICFVAIHKFELREFLNDLDDVSHQASIEFGRQLQQQLQSVA